MDYSFISGQIRAQESKLLNVNRLDRMIGANTPEDAFRVLSELQYSEFLDENASAQSFDSIISYGLVETKEMIEKGVEENSGLLFIWLRFDINNFKRALKRKLLEGKTSLGEFTQENGYSSLGTIGEEGVEKIVFKGQLLEGIDEEFLEVVSRAQEILDKNNNEFRFVEYALDQVYFQVLNSFSKKSYSTFLKDLFSYMAQSTNFRNLARSVFILEEKIPKETWIPFGKLSYLDVEKTENFSDFIKVTERTNFSGVAEDLSESNGVENLVIIEKYLDKCYQNFLDESVLGEIASIQIPFVYFEKRLQNSRLLKFVMFAKFNGLSSKEIYKTLEKF